MSTLSPTLEQIIIDKVKFQNGIRDIELAIKTMEAVNPQSFDSSEYNKALCKLVDNQDLIKVEYCCRHELRWKCIYFIKGTEFKWTNMSVL